MPLVYMVPINPRSRVKPIMFAPIARATLDTLNGVSKFMTSIAAIMVMVEESVNSANLDRGAARVEASALLPMCRARLIDLAPRTTPGSAISSAAGSKIGRTILLRAEVAGDGRTISVPVTAGGLLVNGIQLPVLLSW